MEFFDNRIFLTVLKDALFIKTNLADQPFLRILIRKLPTIYNIKSCHLAKIMMFPLATTNDVCSIKESFLILDAFCKRHVCIYLPEINSITLLFFIFLASSRGFPFCIEILQYTQWLCLSSEFSNVRYAWFEPGTTATVWSATNELTNTYKKY